MAKTWIIILALFFLALDVSAQETPLLKTEEDVQSYSLGVDAARSYQKLNVGININLMIQGMKDAATGGKLLMDDGAISSALMRFRSKLAAKVARDRASARLDNKKEGDEFLAANRTKEGVVTLPSGLQYKILKTGEGKTPAKTDTVEVHYRGTLIDGTEFENTYASGKPTLINLSDGRVIAGLREALTLMPVGSKWQLFIPPNLAYRATGKKHDARPNTVLIYELELLAIK